MDAVDGQFWKEKWIRTRLFSEGIVFTHKQHNY